MGKLQGEFQQHMGAFDDDLAFIHEVQTHQTLAAGMNPNVELQVLHKRFNNWKFDFKVRFQMLTIKISSAMPAEQRSLYLDRLKPDHCVATYLRVCVCAYLFACLCVCACTCTCLRTSTKP